MKNLISKIKLRIKKKHCFQANKKNGYSTPDGMCEGHYHNGKAFIPCSKCPYFADRSDKK